MRDSQTVFAHGLAVDVIGLKNHKLSQTKSKSLFFTSACKTEVW